MEKQTAEIRKKCKRLLAASVIFAASAFCMFAQNAVRISYDYIKTLRIKPAQEYFFSSSDGMFKLDIEGVKPEDVDISVERLPENVSFVSSRKETLLAGENVERAGTRVILWLKFAEPGTYRIPQLFVQIGRGLYTIPFEPVTVYTNPRTIQPKISVDFENPAFAAKNRKFTVKAGDHIRFTVNIQYAVQMLNFQWSIPEDSLFQEVQRYDIAKNPSMGTSFSPDVVPIVTFDWQPLVAGTYSLPKILVKATSYSGSTQELTLPSYTITVKNGSFETEELKAVDEDYFDYAFEAPAEEKSVETVQVVEIQNLEELLQLRHRERHSIPYVTSARSDRIAAEKLDGLASDKNEPSVPFLVILIVLTVLLLSGSIVCFIFRKTLTGILTAVFCLCLLVASIVDGVRVGTRYALFEGGEISPIPESYVQSGVSVQPGSRVEIQHIVGGWVYIRYNDNYGWVPEDRILIIR